jgi:hypothetical protein
MPLAMSATSSVGASCAAGAGPDRNALAAEFQRAENLPLDTESPYKFRP